MTQKKRKTVETETKRCARCRKSKPLTDFGPNKKMKSGRKSYCRPCSRIAQREWHAKRNADVERARKFLESNKKRRRAAAAKKGRHAVS